MPVGTEKAGVLLICRGKRAVANIIKPEEKLWRDMIPSKESLDLGRYVPLGINMEWV